MKGQAHPEPPQADVRCSTEVIEAGLGLLGQIRQVHGWTTRSVPRRAEVNTAPDPIPQSVNRDFGCRPSRLLPSNRYYLAAPGQVGCLHRDCWLAFGDGHLADRGARIESALAGPEARPSGTGDPEHPRTAE